MDGVEHKLNMDDQSCQLMQLPPSQQLTLPERMLQELDLALLLHHIPACCVCFLTEPVQRVLPFSCLTAYFYRYSKFFLSSSSSSRLNQILLLMAISQPPNWNHCSCKCENISAQPHTQIFTFPLFLPLGIFRMIPKSLCFCLRVITDFNSMFKVKQCKTC